MPLKPDQIELDMLPLLVQTIAEVVNLDNALKICNAYPSVEIYVPHEAREDHTLALLIGMDAMERFCAEFGGEQMTIPKLAATKRKIKYETAKELRRNGALVSDVARHLDYSERHVFRITEGFKEDDDQLDLFGEPKK